MRILVSGSSGLVGSALRPLLAGDGHAVGRLLRPGTTAGPDDRVWDPQAGRLDPAVLHGFDAVIHLAGESIAAGRWTQQRKDRIRRSRVEGTQLLSRAIAAAAHPPAVLVSSSAVGFYGDRGDEVLRETSPRGRGFLPAVCVAWESATEPAEARGVRVAHLRFGVILAAGGGALARMLPPFRLGLGGPVGSGRQYMAWITLDDVVRVIRHVLLRDDLSGPINSVAPSPATNGEFTRALGRALGRPAVLPMPAFLARLAFGEMADALLLSSARVVPDRLRASGFSFLDPDLEPALQRLVRPGDAPRPQGPHTTPKAP